MTGDLTIGGVTQPITSTSPSRARPLDPFGNQRVGFEGSVAISRKDYGITWNAALETGGVLVSDKIVLEFEISAIRKVWRVKRILARDKQRAALPPEGQRLPS